ncbi:Twinfilin-1 [Kappamyces sp. JEL0829]|nr:Twinfilin-1 [Kappamyces sp. JEL0829]
MALSSGVAVSNDLKQALANPAVVALQVVIEGEAFIVKERVDASLLPAAFSFVDILPLIQPWVAPGKAAFLVVRSRPESCQDPNSAVPGMTLIQFTPDSAPVREKTMYSSSKAILVKALPVDPIYLWSVFCTKPQECSWEGLQAFLGSELAPAPFSDQEKEKALHLLQEASSGVGLSTRATNASGLNFGMTAEAATAVKQLGSTVGCLVGLGIHDEKTVLAFTKDGITADGVAKATPPNVPLFLFFRNTVETVFAYGWI